MLTVRYETAGICVVFEVQSVVKDRGALTVIDADGQTLRLPDDIDDSDSVGKRTVTVTNEAGETVGRYTL